ncbi:MAG TPA: glycine--tRNA ligase subunit beta [Spirochaetota bacterium]|nr:glycine--tRNA ligase subunit beta [Spirochaetota bacterium]HQJ72141.1 glycine--tRNA ligase subunit beta [Spirochaetota bacterium]HRS78591.1 glycine--tRNA ligase subunit beta [Spirochaetota bacterium]HRT76515.1 glycine--tRNA ligase subunit beta [Spirochaetota bacterium]
MLKDANFLLELGTEEIPAGYIPPAIEAVKKVFVENLGGNRINFDSIEVYATPRRIAVLISKLAASQREEEVELKGPSVKAAYDPEGKPTKALEGFIKGNGISAADVFTRESDKGSYVFAKKKLEAKKTESLLPAIITQIVGAIPFPKRMRWSDKTVTFPRPIRYFVILFDNRVIPFEIDGIASSNMTRGHYIQNNRMVEIGDIGSYDDILKMNGVIVDQAERKEMIRKDLAAAAKQAGGKLLDDEDLLDAVTYLVERPYICECRFDRQFLALPDIVLIAEMREHQKYFSVVDGGGKLTDAFLVVSNNPPTANVRAGNERVISARFNDARFFYSEDRKMKLGDRVESLKTVLFHKELGSIYDKVARMHAIAAYIGERLGLDAAQRDRIARAVDLCKTDLMTAVVFEFPSLQGHIGKIYALEDGEAQDVADAIEDHYKPRFSGEAQPTGMTSIVLSLAEKIDNIFGSFSVGNIPKGSADPYALRRQSNAIVELLIRNEINLELKDLLDSVAGNYRGGKELAGKIVEFVAVRAKTIYAESGLSHDEIDACLSTGASDYLELYRRAKSVNQFRKNENFSRMLLSFKRMNNIVSAFRKENAAYALSLDPSLFQCDEERDLHRFFDSRAEAIDARIASSSYIELFELLIEGKPIIDRFFDKVLVMDRDVKLRDNRLAVLENILKHFTTLMDFSRIEDR